ncbi:hypothetical protein AX16_007776 [Volvariella volvacea WC 439]|nr:hypothetical protein AX16_007776 [Volvariella volvacea WC 439]
MVRTSTKNKRQEPRSRKVAVDRAIPDRLERAKNYIKAWGRRVAAPNVFPKMEQPHEMGTITLDGQYSASRSPFQQSSPSLGNRRETGRHRRRREQANDPPNPLTPTPLHTAGTGLRRTAQHTRPEAPALTPSPLQFPFISLSISEPQEEPPTTENIHAVFYSVGTTSTCPEAVVADGGPHPVYPYPQQVYQNNGYQSPPSQFSLFSPYQGYSDQGLLQGVQNQPSEYLPYIGDPDIQQLQAPSYDFDSYATHSITDSSAAQLYQHNLFLPPQYSSPNPSTPSSISSNFSTASSSQDTYAQCESQVMEVPQHPYYYQPHPFS